MGVFSGGVVPNTVSLLLEEMKRTLDAGGGKRRTNKFTLLFLSLSGKSGKSGERSGY